MEAERKRGEQSEGRSLFLGGGWRRRGGWILLIGLTILPLVILVLEVHRYAVDIPFWDQWNFVPLLGRAFDGHLHFSDLWQQHNEHRLFFPRLLMIGLARLSGYNILGELIANIVLATVILVLGSWQFFRARKVLGLGGFPWVIPVFSLLVYSLNQGENWLWGWQIQIFLNAAAVVGGFCLLGGAGKRFRWGRFWGAMVAGVVAVFSFANGLVFWVVALAALARQEFDTRKQKRLGAGTWAAAIVGLFALYFYRFRLDSPSGKPWFYFLAHPLIYARYVFQYMGATIINYETGALVFGLVGLLFFGGMSFLLWRRARGTFQALHLFFLLGLYALGCAMLTGIGRAGFGPVQAMSYRYVTFSSLLWMANFVYLFLLFQLSRQKLKKRIGRALIQSSLFLFVFLLLFGIGRTSYRVGHRVFVTHHQRLFPVYQEIRQKSEPSNELLLRLYVDADYVREGMRILQKHRLSVFRWL